MTPSRWIKPNQGWGFFRGGPRPVPGRSAIPAFQRSAIPVCRIAPFLHQKLHHAFAPGNLHQGGSSQIKVGAFIADSKDSPLRPSRPLRETNFTHPHLSGPKRRKTHLFADNFQRSCRGNEADQSASSQIKVRSFFG
jgi:hypothetical protein